MFLKLKLNLFVISVLFSVLFLCHFVFFLFFACVFGFQRIGSFRYSISVDVLYRISGGETLMRFSSNFYDSNYFNLANFLRI